MVSFKRHNAAKKAWATRKKLYGKDGLSAAGEAAIRRSNRRR